MIMKKALIYCRVSSHQQVTDWQWLSSQEKRCYDYAVSKWFEVEKSFHEEWISWAILDRKSLNALLLYIDKNQSIEYVVIFDDLKRIARDVSVYLTLKKDFQMRWVHFESPNFKFEDSPEWRFIEVIMAGQAELEREQNRRQVIQKQRARVEQWYWCFHPPRWFEFKVVEGHGKLLVQNDEVKHIKKWLERFANEENFSAYDLARFLIKKWLKNVATMWKHDVILYIWRIYRMLNSPLYAWYLELPIWDIKLQKAKHEWIISLQTFQKIQEKMNGSNIRKWKVIQKNERKDLSADFPLRWFLYCEESWNSMSGCWTKWNTTRVPYYVYPRKSPMKWKSINRDKFHKEFEVYLDTLTPNNGLVNLFKLIFTEELEKHRSTYKDSEAQKHIEIDKYKKTIDKYFDRIKNTESLVLIEWYEKEIEKLQENINNVEKNIKRPMGRQKNVRTLLDEMLRDVCDAKNIWLSSKLEDQITLLKSIFPEGIPITKNRGVWTPKLSLVYQALQHWKKSKFELVELDGFEPTSFGVDHVYLLS